MELGLGIHGEPGCSKVAWEPVDKLVPHMLQTMGKAKDFRHLQLNKGRQVVLMVNNLGATSAMEMYIVARQAAQYITEEGMKVHNCTLN